MTPDPLRAHAPTHHDGEGGGLCGSVQVRRFDRRLTGISRLPRHSLKAVARSIGYGRWPGSGGFDCGLTGGVKNTPHDEEAA